MGKNFVEKNIAIIGLGYVGLPLAISFGKNILLMVLIYLMRKFQIKRKRSK